MLFNCFFSNLPADFEANLKAAALTINIPSLTPQQVKLSESLYKRINNKTDITKYKIIALGIQMFSEFELEKENYYFNNRFNLLKQLSEETLNAASTYQEIAAKLNKIQIVDEYVYIRSYDHSETMMLLGI